MKINVYISILNKCNLAILGSSKFQVLTDRVIQNFFEDIKEVKSDTKIFILLLLLRFSLTP